MDIAKAYGQLSIPLSLKNLTSAARGNGLRARYTREIRLSGIGLKRTRECDPSIVPTAL